VNPLTRIPDSVRFALYLTYGIGYPVTLYLKAKGYIGAEEMDMFNGIGAFLGATAASNMSPRLPRHGGDTTDPMWSPKHDDTEV
jgi:hypothetical protein